jgi:tetratricopeptide (TPR) repeat protein
VDRSSTSTTESAFVGRDHEIGQGLAALDDVLAGRGRLLLVAGEPGIGKSRMADVLATHAKDRGVRVLWGRCWEAGGAPAFWPWVQSLRALLRNLTAEQVRAQMAGGAADIAQLLPEVREVIGDMPVPSALDPDAARFRLFDSTVTFLKNAAAVQPLMLVLDDLQVADTPSLLLLQFIAGALGDDHLFVLGTYRDTEVWPDHPLSATLTQLGREHAVRMLSLKGLGVSDVARFITGIAGSSPQENVVRTVHDATDGNPLFLGEIVRLLVEEGRLEEGMSGAGTRLGVPRSVSDVIGQRLGRLSDPSLHILTLASVFGREFSLDGLSNLADRSLDDTFEALEEPLAARVVTDVPGARGRLRFSHVMVRESLYDEMGRTRRLQLHRQAAQVLERLYRNDLDHHLAELAHHYFEGVPGGDLEKAIAYARMAGDQAVSLLAYEEAVRLYRMALQGMDLRNTADQQERCDVLLALGDAEARAGDQPGSKETFLQAADLGRSIGLGDHVARAALGYGGRLVWGRAGDDRHLIPLLRDGLAAVGEGDSVLRAMLLSRLAGALRDDPAPEPRESLSEQAVDIARRIGDPATLAYTLGGMFAALWRPDNPEDRLAIASEMVAVGEGAGDREQVLHGHQNKLLVFLELGDIKAVYRELDAVDRFAGELRQPAQSWLAAGAQALLALLEGRYDDAEQLRQAALHIGERSNPSDAISHHALQLFQLRREQGRLAEVEELISASARDFTWYPMFRCALAVLYCEQDREREARIEFEDLTAENCAALPFDNEWLFSLSFLSEVAFFLGDASRAAILYEKLTPHAERVAFGAVEGCGGSISHYLGLLATTMSRFDQAAQHFERGLQQNERMGARPWVAHTQHDLAVVLAKRRGPGDLERAIELLVSARQTCDEIGMPPLRAEVVRALAALGVATVAPVDRGDGPASAAGEAPKQVDSATFQLEGEYWTISYEGKVQRLRDSKGLRVLARLLANPGRPYSSLDLERMGATGDEATARAAASGDAGELLDDEARRAYRTRLTELAEAIEDAEASGKADQAGSLREEKEFLTRELSRALGLGGRSRRAGSVAERARLNVSRAVKATLQHIAAADGELAAHLGSTVHTGVVCIYSPDTRAPVGWTVSHGDIRQS